MVRSQSLSLFLIATHLHERKILALRAKEGTLPDRLSSAVGHYAMNDTIGSCQDGAGADYCGEGS